MRSICLELLLLLLPTSALHPQDRDLDAFGEVIDVRVLNLEVAVTGKDGEHVTGLGPEDFRLFVDDDEVAIEYFSEIRQGTARTSSQEISAVPSVTPGEVVGTSFLLFVANFFGHARDRDLVLSEILSTLPDLGPEDRMIQALLNLGRNALQAVGDAGRVLLRTRAVTGFTIGDTRHPLVLRIDVEDTGPGVPEELRDRIFYPLVTGRRDGTGLGLAVAQDIANRHGGLIKLMRGEHTVFSVYLPVENGASEKEEQPK